MFLVPRAVHDYGEDEMLLFWGDGGEELPEKVEEQHRFVFYENALTCHVDDLGQVYRRSRGSLGQKVKKVKSGMYYRVSFQLLHCLHCVHI